jgi:SAM-dependent methyltransferase
VTRTESRILDVGCGSGTLGKIFTEKGHDVDGITISPDEYEIAKIYLNNTFIHNLETGLPDTIEAQTYDYVICSHVLEHIVYPSKLLGDILKVLKPEGILIVALPNIMHYKSRMKLAIGKFDYQDAGLWDYTHVKWYTFETAKKLFVEHGFSIELAMVTGDLPFNSIFSKIFSPRMSAIFFKLLTKVSKGFFGYQLLYMAKKH